MICFHRRLDALFLCKTARKSLAELPHTERCGKQKSKQELLGPSVDWLPASVWPPPRGNHKAAADWERVNKAASVSEDTYSALHAHAQTIHAAWESHQRL